MSEPYLSEIRMWACNFAPVGWSYCNGQLLPINQNQALFSLLGITYGGNGTTNFGLPDLRGRVPLHYGESQGPGLSAHYLGQKSGAENTSQLIAHTHTAELTSLDIGSINAKLRCKNATADLTAASGNSLANSNRQTYVNAAPDSDMNSASIEVSQTGTPSAEITIGATGNAQTIATMPPYTAVNFCIAISGVYPSRP